MKAPNGKDTNLTERQWVMVRTPNFKKWFGDWETLAIINELESMPAMELVTPTKAYSDNKEIKELTKHLNIIFDKLKNCLSGNIELLDLFEETSICLALRESSPIGLKQQID